MFCGAVLVHVKATDLERYFEAVPVLWDCTIAIEGFAYSAIPAVAKAKRWSRQVAASDEDMIWEIAFDYMTKRQQLYPSQRDRSGDIGCRRLFLAGKTRYVPVNETNSSYLETCAMFSTRLDSL
jgi:hypothetical protein